jgi:hypothetical protein
MPLPAQITMQTLPGNVQTLSVSLLGIKMQTVVFYAPPPVAALPAPTPPRPESTLRYVQSTSGSGADAEAGQNVSVFPVLNSSLRLSSRSLVLAEAILKRWTTRRGSLPFHADFGVDIRQWLNAALDTATLYQIKASLEREAEKDERVFAIVVTPSYSATTETLRIDAEVASAEEVFRFSTVISKLGVVQLLEDDNV